MILGYINLINLVIYLEVTIIAHLLSAYLPRRSQYVLRVVLSTALGGLLTYFLPVFLLNSFLATFAYSFFMYICILVFVILTIVVCIDAKWINYLFCAVGGYAFHHLSSTLQAMIERILWKGESGSIFQAPYIFAYIIPIAIILTFVITLTYKRKDMQALVNRKGVVGFSALIVLLNIALSSLVMLSNYYAKNSIIAAIPTLYNFVTSILAIVFLFGILERGQLEHEVEVINQLYKENIRQYELSKVTMESLHDLKHRVNAMMAGQMQLTDEEKKEISDKIFIFDNMIKTGNDTLDIILAEKRMLCHQYDIQLNCMVDGEGLSFMEVYDIYSLFGNALSNAIEAVNRQPLDEARMIFLGVKRTDNYLSIHLENTFYGNISISDGVPVTKKEDPNAHGFGMKSMLKIAEKYKGKMTFTIQDELFCLDILFPV